MSVDVSIPLVSYVRTYVSFELKQAEKNFFASSSVQFDTRENIVVQSLENNHELPSSAELN